MSSKTKKQFSTEPRAISAREAATLQTQIADSARHQKIRIRAYEIYLERGEQPGCDLDDWLRAERELTTNQNG